VAIPASWLVVPIVIVFPMALACWTSSFASVMFCVSTGEESYAAANTDLP
jgi:hypothetical protein